MAGSIAVAAGTTASNSSSSAGTDRIRETRTEPVTVAVGLIVVAVAIVVAILGWAGFDDAMAGPSTAVESEGFTLLVVLLEFGGAAIVARGLLFPRTILPGDENLLCGPSRRAASSKSRVTERAAVFLVGGAAILVTALLLPFAALVAPGVCSGGPCIPPSPPVSVELWLIVGGIAAMGIGAVIGRRVRRSPAPGAAQDP